MLQKQTYQHLQIRRIGAALLCLSLFLSGQFRAQFQHYLEHSVTHEALHGQEAEADACHQAVFHTGSNAACEHPVHLTATNTECELCDCLLQVTGFHLLTIKLSSPQRITQVIFTFLLPAVYSPVLSATARGPPSFIV